MPVTLRLASPWIAVVALVCGCGTTAPVGNAGAAAPQSSQPNLEEAGGFERLADLAEAVAWLRQGNRELTVRDPQVAGHEVLVQVDPCSVGAKALCKGVGEDAVVPDQDADFTVIVRASDNPGLAKRLQALAFQGPDSARGGYWRYLPDWEDHEVANLIESVFRRAWLSPIGYRVVIQRRQVGEL